MPAIPTSIAGINLFETLNRYGLDRAAEMLGVTREQLLGMVEGGGLSPELMGLEQELAGMPAGFRGLYEPSGAIGDMLPLIQQMIQGGGWTPRGEEGFRGAMDIFGGRTTGQSEAQNAALEALGLRGRNANLASWGGLASGMMGNQGVGADQRRMYESGFGTLDRGGMTPELAALAERLGGAFGFAGGELGRGGMNPELAQLMQSVQGIVSSGGAGGALLPMEQVQSFARDAAITASQGQAEAARRAALALGGGPGSRLSGGQFRGLAEFGDQTARAEAGALREATMGQQGLQLQQLLGALQSGVGLQDVAARRLGTFGGLQSEMGRALAALQGTAAQRYGVGSELVGRAQEGALGRFGAGSTLGRGVEQQVGTNLGQALEALNALMQTRNQAGEVGRGFAGLDITNLGNALQTFASLMSQNTAQGGEMLRGNLLASGQRGDILRAGPTNRLTALGQLGTLGQGWMNYAQGTFNPLAGVYNQGQQVQATPSWWQQLLAQAAQGAAGGAASGFGNWIGRQPGATRGTTGGGTSP